MMGVGLSATMEASVQLGLSESARATSAAESRHRIDYPNSRRRESRVIALDDGAAALLPALARQRTSEAHFLRFVQSNGLNEALKNVTIDAVLEDVGGEPRMLTAEVSDTDIVIMIAIAGFQGRSAEVVGNACLVRGKTITGIILRRAATGASQLAATLDAMRPFTTMLVVASDGEETTGEILSALRV